MSRLQPREGRTVPELALRFVWANPNVCVALSGMNTMEMVAENVAIADTAGPLSAVEDEDIQTMLEQLQGLEDLYCTGCGYCMPCSSGVDIPTNLLLLNYVRFYGLGEGAKQRYEAMLVSTQASADYCIACDECLPKCPQNIPIPDRLEDLVVVRTHREIRSLSPLFQL